MIRDSGLDWSTVGSATDVDPASEENRHIMDIDEI
jgi:hypothetical protein